MSRVILLNFIYIIDVAISPREKLGIDHSEDTRIKQLEKMERLTDKVDPSARLMQNRWHGPIKYRTECGGIRRNTVLVRPTVSLTLCFPTITFTGISLLNTYSARLLYLVVIIPTLRNRSYTIDRRLGII